MDSEQWNGWKEIIRDHSKRLAALEHKMEAVGEMKGSLSSWVLFLGLVLNAALTIWLGTRTPPPPTTLDEVRTIIEQYRQLHEEKTRR